MFERITVALGGRRDQLFRVVFLRKFERLVNHNLRRSGPKPQFVNPQAQYAAIYCSEPVNPPVLGKFHDQLVNRFRFGDGSLK